MTSENGPDEGERTIDGATLEESEGTLETPGDALRSLPVEAQQRGTRFVSAEAMQARLFSVYDAAAAAEDALKLVQDHLTRTLGRRYYEADEIEEMAAQLDALLALEAIDIEAIDIEGLDSEPVGSPTE